MMWGWQAPYGMWGTSAFGMVLLWAAAAFALYLAWRWLRAYERQRR